MIQIESLVLSLLIDAKEGRDVATTDVVGDNLLADMQDCVLIRFTGKAVGVMCEVNIKYTHFEALDNGK